MELVLGTDERLEDTDSDGVLDGAEVQQGTDPLDGLIARTGIVATADTPGDARDIAALNDLAVVADRSEGMSLFNVFNGMNPTIIAQVDTPGDAVAVAMDGTYVAVGDSAAGLVIVDVSDPPAAVLLHQVGLGYVQAVAAGGGVAYAGTTNGDVYSVDLLTGRVIDSVRVAGSVHDLGLGEDVLYALSYDNGTRVSAIPLTEGSLRVSGSAVLGGGTGAGGRRLRLFVGLDVAYATHTSGYNTFELAEPRLPRTIAAGGTTQFGWRHIVANGSGLGFAAAGPNSTDDGPHNVQLYDVSDPLLTDLFLTEFETPGNAAAVSIYNGLGYVADALAGIQVINYLAYDANGIPPEIALSSNFAAGVAEEGKIMRLTATVNDDVQVRNVEFYIDGVRAAADGNYPFEHRFVTPLIAEQPSFTVRAKATDTGGNSTWTVEETLVLVPDATPPKVIGVNPVGTALLEADALSANFNEPIAAATLDATSWTLLEAGADGTLGTGDDVAVTDGAISYRDDIRTGLMTFAAFLAPGRYRSSLGAGVTDLRGNALVPYEWDFRILDLGTDSDGDGVPDEVETILLGLDPGNPDSDGDGIPDGLEDADGDGLVNAAELVVGTDPTDADSDDDGVSDALEDGDGDGLSNVGEYIYGTDPANPDSDGDGWPDGVEVDGFADPLDAFSVAGQAFTWAAPAAVTVTLSAIGVAGAPASVTVARPPTVTVVVPAAGTPDAPVSVTVARPPAVTVVVPAIGTPDAPPSVAVARPPSVTVVVPAIGTPDAQPSTTCARPPVDLVWVP